MKCESIKDRANLNVCCVMSTTHAAIMICQGIEFIYLTPCVVLVRNIICQIEVMNGKIYKCVKLVLHRPTVGESFQVNNKNFWKPPKVQFLACLAPLLALRTVPSSGMHSHVRYNITIILFSQTY